MSKDESETNAVFIKKMLILNARLLATYSGHQVAGEKRQGGRWGGRREEGVEKMV